MRSGALRLRDVLEPRCSRLSVLVRCGPGMPGPYKMRGLRVFVRLVGISETGIDFNANTNTETLQREAMARSSDAAEHQRRRQVAAYIVLRDAVNAYWADPRYIATLTRAGCALRVLTPTPALASPTFSQGNRTEDPWMPAASSFQWRWPQ